LATRLSEQQTRLLLATAAEWRALALSTGPGDESDRAAVAAAFRRIFSFQSVRWHDSLSDMLHHLRRERCSVSHPDLALRVEGALLALPWLHQPLVSLEEAERLIGWLPQSVSRVVDVPWLCLPVRDRLVRCIYGDFLCRLNGDGCRFFDDCRTILSGCGFCTLSGSVLHLVNRPDALTVDENGLLHSAENGTRPAFASGTWREWYWHGLRLRKPMPAKMNFFDVATHSERRIRRCMIEAFGVENFIREAAQFNSLIEVDSSKWGRLLCVPLQGDSYTVVEVENTTRYPDGSRPKFYLQVDPDCRPLLRLPDGSMVFGSPQPRTALNAVASTFGMTGEEYQANLLAEA